MISELSKSEIQTFIEEHLYDNPAALMLQASRFPDMPMAEVVAQIQSKRKAKSKLPTWFETTGIIYPPRLSMEQCSSEETALYKTGLVKGEAMVDLTGGFGVDSYYLAKNFEEAHYVERSASLAEVVGHNFTQLATNISVHTNDSIAFLERSNEHFSLIYVDPARRGDHDQKVFKFEDCEPDVAQHMSLLKKRADKIMIKASPLLEIKQGIEALGGVSEVHVVAVQNEVKELLFIIDKKAGLNPQVHAVNLKSSEKSPFVFDFEGEAESIATLSEVETYLYEPNAAIMKAGGFNSIAKAFSLEKLQANTQLYTSTEGVPGFPGRTFKVLNRLSMNKKELRKAFPQGKVNITARNFPMAVAQIRKKTSLKEGGDEYLIACTDIKGPMLLHCQRL